MSDDLLSEFIAESSDHLTRAEEILLAFGAQPGKDDPEAVNACFRSLHTIKGCSGFLDIPRVMKLSHAGEQILDALRTYELGGSSAVFDALLTTVYRLRDHLAHLGGQDVSLPDTDDDCFHLLESVRNAPPSTVPAAVTPTAGPAVQVPSSSNLEDPLDTISTAIAELIIAGSGDKAGVGAIIDGLANAMLRGSWNPEARVVITRMRQLVDAMTGAAAKDQYLNILKHCEQLESLQRLPMAVATATDGSAQVTIADEPVTDQSASVITEFLAEATELLNQAEAGVLGRTQFTAEEVNAIFRSFHTVKGMAGYLGQTDIERSAHHYEARIQPVRDGAVKADESFASTVLSGVDAVRELMQAVTQRLAVCAMPEASASPAEAVPEPEATAPTPQSVSANPANPANLANPANPANPAVVKPSDGASKAPAKAADKAAGGAPLAKAPADAFSRVATGKLEDLMNQVGELLIAQAMVQHHPDLQANSHLAQAVVRQGRILRSLQVLSLSLRMVPLRGTFQKMARVVYDTAKKIGKKVDFSLGGEETEIDRTLAETMSDPLMHMVRNAIDHGIESPEVRVANGKSEAGNIRLEAYQAGDDVVICLKDDGAGMDAKRLRAKAIEKGLIDSEQAMDEQACFQLIFLPGFSTAAKVTDVSGRGVGMDVVRRQVEEANGTVFITSEVGQGTTFTIRLPMTTAILDAMQLKVGSENLLMPISSIVEMLRPKAGQVQTILDRGHVIQHRERMLPLVHLGQALGISGCIMDPGEAILVVIENRGADFVIQVDAILGQRQVVIKPFDEGVAHHLGTSGTTILGDGRVALILNPAFLVRQHADLQNA